MTDGPRHLLSLAALDDAEFGHLFERAAALADGAAPGAPLAGLTLANLFCEPSTRTRASFELAARRIGATVLNLDLTRSSAVKGESLADTVRTLHAMHTELFVIRHADEDALVRLARTLGDARLAIANAGEGRTEHPTQGLIDALTIHRHFGGCAGIQVAIVGDIAHSRVARSAVHALHRLGAALRIAGPASLMPGAGEIPEAARCARFDDALEGAQVVMMLRVQRERIAAGGAPDAGAYFADWGLTEARLARAHPDAVVMHPGPFNRDVEIASDVADGPRQLIWHQVALGIPVRMAVLEWLAAGL